MDNWLIGSISERKELKSEIEFNFMESLKSDKEKYEVKLAEETNKLAKVKLMNVRASRVASETRIYEEYLQITIRHPTEGVMKRRLNSKEHESLHLFANVYD